MECHVAAEGADKVEDVSTPAELGDFARDRWYERRIISVQEFRDSLEEAPVTGCMAQPDLECLRQAACSDEETGQGKKRRIIDAKVGRGKPAPG